MWYVLRVKNMHFWSPSDPQGLLGKAKMSYVHDNIRRGKAEHFLSKLIAVFHLLHNVGPNSCVR